MHTHTYICHTETPGPAHVSIYVYTHIMYTCRHAYNRMNYWKIFKNQHVMPNTLTYTCEMYTCTRTHTYTRVHKLQERLCKWGSGAKLAYIHM